MTEKEFIKMVEEELFPALSYRFGNGSVSVLEDFDSFAIPLKYTNTLMTWKWINFLQSQRIYLHLLEFGRRY